MKYDYKIKYRTLDQVLNSVADDWSNYDTENYVDQSQLIRVIRRVNSQLGLRITKTKETIVPFENYVANMPDDIEKYNFSVLCGDYMTTFEIPQGVTTENVDVDCEEACGPVYITPLGGTYRVVQRAPETGTYYYSILKRVTITSSQYDHRPDEVTGYFLSENFMRLNIKSGNLYINYEGVLEKDGQILVVDHPLVNDYYEYAIKERILENMFFTGEDVSQKLAYIQTKLQQAKREAYNVTNMPEFSELQETLELNREAMAQKYYEIFL